MKTESKEHLIMRLKFKNLRENAKLTYSQLSNIFNNKLSVRQIRDIENGKRNIHILDLILYKEVFHCCFYKILNRTQYINCEYKKNR